MRPFNPELHEAGERIAVPRHYAEMASWQVAAELVRRHPNEFVVIETHPGGGQYDCLSIYERKVEDERLTYQKFADLNRAPRGHVTSRGRGVGTDRLNWVDVLFASDLRRDVIIPMERAAELRSPTASPATTASSVGVRLIAEVLSLRVATRSPLIALNAVYDSSNGAGVREYFSLFPAVKLKKSDGDGFSIRTVDTYRYWFVCAQLSDETNEAPHFCVDTWDGKLWYQDTKAASLMELYDNHGRDVTALATSVLFELGI